MKILVVGAAGYIGSRVSMELQKSGHVVVGCDKNAPILPECFETFLQTPYQDLNEQHLNDIDLTVWFAGHSTVGMSVDDPLGCLDNNVMQLMTFAKLLDQLQIPMIYASSASILSTTEENHSMVSNEERSNTYDASKLAFDVLAKTMNYRVVGLRLGTVAGWSPNMRWDTLFNSMNKAACFDGVVRASNCSNFRGVLFLDDLIAYLLNLIENKDTNEQARARQVGLASWSGSIGSMASSIASYWNVPIEFGADSGTYSFVVNDREISSVLPKEKLYLSIAQRCELFKKQNSWQS